MKPNVEITEVGREVGGRGTKKRNTAVYCGVACGFITSYVAFFSVLLLLKGRNSGLSSMHHIPGASPLAQPLPLSSTTTGVQKVGQVAKIVGLDHHDGKFNAQTGTSKSPAMTDAERQVLDKITYWKRKKLTKPLTDTFPAHHDKYVTMELDLGGFNNVRMSFEAVITAAMVSIHLF